MSAMIFIDGFGRIDIGVADHELLEDVVLDGPGELLLLHALLFGGDDVAGEDRQHGAVHRHRDGDLVERDAVEEDLHVLDRVDRHAGLADVADDAGIVRVVAAVRGQVEGDRDALAAGGERLAVEGVGGFGGGETGVLADRPGFTAYIVACGPRTKGAKPGRVSVYSRLAISCFVLWRRR